MEATMFVYLLFAFVPLTQAAVPGSFFWKPRVGLDLAVPTKYPRTVLKPTKDNVYKGMVVLIDGYQAGLTVAALAATMEDMQKFHHLHPGSAYYYTNMYRWALRYLSLIPEWLGGKNMNFVATHKVWTKRFYYMDKFVPHWMRKLLFFVKKEEWEREEYEWSKFVKYTEPAFGKYYKYPSKKFNNWNSMRYGMGTVENLDITNASIQ